MWGLFELLKFSFSSIIWGILITILCMTLFFILIRGWYKSAVFTPISYLIGIILFFLLTFQCTLIIGAIKITETCPFYEKAIQQIVDNYYSPAQEVSLQESKSLVKNLLDEYPILQYYFASGEFTGYTARELPSAIGASIRSFLHSYIMRRLLWSLGFVVIGAVLVIQNISRSYGSRRNKPSVRTLRRSSRPMTGKSF